MHRPCASEVSCRSVVPNQHPSDDLQSGCCSSTSRNDSDKHSSCKTQTEQNGCLSHTEVRTVDGLTEASLEITHDNIHIQQKKDLTLRLILQWQNEGIKLSWNDVAQYCKELKVYWYHLDLLEIKDEILCKKYVRDDGTGMDYLYIIPPCLRKEIFKHLHGYVTGGHLGRSKTYEKLRKRFYWCNMHRDVSY